MLKSRSMHIKYYKLLGEKICLGFVCFYAFLFLATSFYSLDDLAILEPYTLLILLVFKAVIKWSLLDFREMIMVPKMTESGSW